MDTQNTENVVEVSGPTPKGEMEETSGQHRYFFLQAAGIKDCIKACQDKGLKFLNATRQPHSTTRYGVDKDGKQFARRTFQNEIAYLPDTFTWRVKAMENGVQ